MILCNWCVLNSEHSTLCKKREHPHNSLPAKPWRKAMDTRAVVWVKHSGAHVAMSVRFAREYTNIWAQFNAENNLKQMKYIWNKAVLVKTCFMVQFMQNVILCTDDVSF